MKTRKRKINFSLLVDPSEGEDDDNSVYSEVKPTSRRNKSPNKSEGKQDSDYAIESSDGDDESDAGNQFENKRKRAGLKKTSYDKLESTRNGEKFMNVKIKMNSDSPKGNVKIEKPESGFVTPKKSPKKMPSRPTPTKNGGFGHTMTSREKISAANKGNVPWNKGKKRSAADRAKISAGVRARNRAVLLKKLDELGITEEEWLKRRKEFKHHREKVRKYRCLAKKEKEQQQRMEEERIKEAEELRRKKEQEKQQRLEMVRKMQEKRLLRKLKVQEERDKKKKEAAEEKKRKSAESKQNHPATIITRDINWTPHQLDEKSYESICPTKGLGGLICCHSCARMYNGFLSSTTKDMDSQSINNVATELKEMLDLLRDAQSKLEQAVNSTHINDSKRDLWEANALVSATNPFCGGAGGGS